MKSGEKQPFDEYHLLKAWGDLAKSGVAPEKIQRLRRAFGQLPEDIRAKIIASAAAELSEENERPSS